MSTATAPAWLVAGAEVVVYSTGNVSTPANPVRTRVKRVAGQSFTVDGEPRFRIKTMSAECRSGWSSWHRRVVPADSEDARRLLAEQHQQRLIGAADQAYDCWRRDRAMPNRVALIEALQAIKD